MRLPLRVSNEKFRHGFTLAEMLFSLVIGGLIIALLVMAVNRIFILSRQTKGINNLRQLGVAALLFAGDNSDALLPYRMERGPEPHGMWYDKLHQYIGRARGRDGRSNGTIREEPTIFRCPVSNKRYAINKICGWGDQTSGMSQYLRRGQGVIPNTIQETPKIFDLPGGLSRTAWFTTSVGGGDFASQHQRNREHSSYITYPNNGWASVLMMDGSVIRIKDPGFAENPGIRQQEQWVHFFGYYSY